MDVQAPVHTSCNVHAEPTSGIEVQIPAMATEATTADQIIVNNNDNSDLPCYHETRISLPRAAAVSQRNRVADTCAAEKDNDHEDQSYTPEVPSRKRSRSSTTKTAAKKVKTAHEAPVEGQSASSTNTSPSKPPGKKVSTKGKSKSVHHTRAELEGADQGAGATEDDAVSVAEKKPCKVELSEKPSDQGVNGNGGSNPQKKRIRVKMTKPPVDRPHCALEGSFAKGAALHSSLAAFIEEKDSETRAANNLAAGLAEKNNALALENAKLTAEIQRLLAMKPTKSEEICRLTNGLSELANKVANQPEGYNELRVNDDEITITWTQLKHCINVLSLKIAAGMEKGPAIGACESKFSSILGQAAQSAAGNRHLCAAFLQNWLWRRTIEGVIDSEGGPWPASVSQAFVTYHRKLQALLNNEEVTPEFVSQVKSVSCCGIHAAHNAQELRDCGIKEYMPSSLRDRLLVVLDNMIEDLNAFWYPTEDEREGTKKLLDDILNKSKRLSRHLLSSKAIFQIGSLDPVTEPPAQGSTDARLRQHIVVTPSLLKRGTADGENFDQTSYICRSERFELCRSSE